MSRMPHLKELVCHNVSVSQRTGPLEGDVQPFPICSIFAPSPGQCLQRLQLSGASTRIGLGQLQRAFANLTQLKALILADRVNMFLISEREFCEALGKLCNLEEMCIANIEQSGAAFTAEAILATIAKQMSKITLLCLVDLSITTAVALPKFVNESNTLQLLIVAGSYRCWLVTDSNERCLLKRTHIAAAQNPVTVLVGGEVASKIVAFPSHNLQVYPITESMPELLRRPENQFMSSRQAYWLLDMIQHNAKSDIRLWNYLLYRADGFARS